MGYGGMGMGMGGMGMGMGGMYPGMMGGMGMGGMYPGMMGGMGMGGMGGYGVSPLPNGPAVCPKLTCDQMQGYGQG